MRRTIASAALVIAAMGLGRLLNDHVPLGDSADRPFVSTGQVGRPVTLEYAEVTVTGVHVTPTVMGNPASASGGRWLVVDTELLALTRPTPMSGFFLVDAEDHRWIASTRGSECASSASLATGVRHYASFCFDVPRRALDGARLVATRGAWTSHESEFRRDAVAEVDLGIAASDVPGLWGRQAPLDVKESGPVPPEEAPR